MPKPEIVPKPDAPASMVLHINLASREAEKFLRDKDEMGESVAKEEANYRSASTDSSNCGNCKFGRFAPAAVLGRCMQVEGEIAITGISDLYSAKTDGN